MAVKPKKHVVDTLKQKYIGSVVPAMLKDFGYKNKSEVPRLVKVVVNIGMGKAIAAIKMLEAASSELASIAGQKPVTTRAKKSIAGFKLREGVPIGCMVTLRRARMYEFLERLIHTALPRIRDFRGISSSAFDGRGNYTLGLKEQVIFPEIKYDGVTAVHGMDIAIVTTAKNDTEGRALLKYFGFPFRK